MSLTDTQAFLMLARVAHSAPRQEAAPHTWGPRGL